MTTRFCGEVQDVLAICGGTLPAWTERLVFGARFLFPFALRRAWFKSTALGLPRALAHLQARSSPPIHQFSKSYSPIGICHSDTEASVHSPRKCLAVQSMHGAGRHLPGS